MGSQQTGELAGNFYCFLWQRTTSSSCVCAVSQVCCSRPQISVLKHMRQTSLGSRHRPLKTSLSLIAFRFPFIDCLHRRYSLLNLQCILCNCYNTLMNINLAAATLPFALCTTGCSKSVVNKFRFLSLSNCLRTSAKALEHSEKLWNNTNINQAFPVDN